MRRALALVAVLCCHPAISMASTSGHGSVPEVSADGGRLAPAERLFREHRILVRSPAGVSRALIEDLFAGMESLPAKARHFPGGVLEIHVHQEPAPFGLGSGSGETPEWTEGTRVFHLYAYTEPDDERRALFRLASLSPAQREHLWRQRAVVHAVIRRWDDRLRWSRREGWKRITGWMFPGDQPFVFQEQATNGYDWAYSRRRGMDSAALDLATFAEEALVPAESMSHEPPGDDSVRCQEFSKRRYLAELLRALDGSVPSLLAETRCEAFDRWADLPSLSHVEVLFSEPSAVRAQSMFGHLMLRFVRHPGSVGRGMRADGVEVAALVSPKEPGAELLAKGIFGEFNTVFSATNLTVLLTEHLEVAQRDVRRFNLALDEGEQRRLLERVWELQRRGYFPYYFLSDNCASRLLFLLNGVLRENRTVRLPSGFAILPVEVLDQLSGLELEETLAGRSRTVPLLQRVYPDFRSRRSVALDAEPRRDELLAELIRRVPAPVAGDWRVLAVSVRSVDVAVREQAFRQLPELYRRTLHGGVAQEIMVEEMMHQLLFALLQVERYVAQRSLLDKTRAAPAVWRGYVVPHYRDTQEMELLRKAGQEREGNWSLEAEMLLPILGIERLDPNAEGRVPSDGKERALERPSSTFGVLTGVVGALLASDFKKSIGTEGGVVDSTVERVSHASVRRSGYGRFTLGLVFNTALAPGPLLQVTSALFAERLGENRQNGFNPKLELRVMDARSRFTLQEGTPRLNDVDLTLIRLRNLNLEPRVLRFGIVDELGWGFGVDTRYRRGGGVLHLHGEGYKLLGAAHDLSSFILVGFGLQSSIPYEPVPSGVRLGPRLELVGRLRLFGEYGNALRLEASYSPTLEVVGPEQWKLGHQGALTAEVQVLLPVGKGPLVGVTPGMAMTVASQSNGDTVAIGTTLSVEWL